MAGATIPRSMKTVLGRSSSVSTVGALKHGERAAPGRRRAPRVSVASREVGAIWHSSSTAWTLDGSLWSVEASPLPPGAEGVWWVTASAHDMGAMTNAPTTLTVGIARSDSTAPVVYGGYIPSVRRTNAVPLPVVAADNPMASAVVSAAEVSPDPSPGAALSWYSQRIA